MQNNIDLIVKIISLMTLMQLYLQYSKNGSLAYIKASRHNLLSLTSRDKQVGNSGVSCWPYHRLLITVMNSLLLIGVLSLSACDASTMGKLKKIDNIDSSANLSRKDYEDFLLPDKDTSKIEETPQKQPDIPELTDIITAPQEPDVAGDKLISLSVTEEVPIKDVLIELGRLADVDVEIDPGISGGVIFSVKDKPFKQVLERMIRMAGLRTKYEDGILRIERDLPYLVSYNTDFLNIDRSNTGSVSLNTSVLSSQGSSGITSGSTNSLTSKYEGDLWKSVDETIKDILSHNNVSLAKVSSAEGGGNARAASNLGGGGGSNSGDKQTYTINKQAGIITIMGTQKAHGDFVNYITKVKNSVASQVMIEAKILEVSLKDQYRYGINFGKIFDSATNLNIAGNFPKPAFESGTSAAETFKLGFINSKGIERYIEAMEAFGVTRTISSPRINATNNQQAVMTFAKNQIYFKVKIEQSTATGTNGTGTVDTSTVNSEINSVPIGVILSLQPSIDVENNEVTLNIRPTLSSSSSAVKDPSVELEAKKANIDVSSEIPIVEVRELDSVMRLKSGEVMVIGGLMKQQSENQDVGIPFFSKIPVIGNLGKSVAKGNNVVETVIFIKATIVPPTVGVAKEDKKFYNTFSRDTHPLTF